MEKHYLENMGEITYVYGVDLEEHTKVIEKQQKRIAELEQELAKYKELQDQLGLKNADEFEWFVMLDLLTDNEKNMHILDLHRELAELKEKAIVPKFKVGKEIYFVVDKVEKGKIEKVFITVSKNDDEDSIFYSITDTYGYALRLPEEQVFATEQEAQEKLKEIQGNE